MSDADVALEKAWGKLRIGLTALPDSVSPPSSEYTPLLCSR